MLKCMIRVGGLITSNICKKIIQQTPHTNIALDVYNDNTCHFLDSADLSGHIYFHRHNIKHDSRLTCSIKVQIRFIELQDEAVARTVRHIVAGIKQIFTQVT